MAVHLNLFPVLRIDDDGDRPIVDQRDLHVRSELARLDRFAQVCGEFPLESIVKGDGDFGSGGPAVGRPVAFLCAGKKGELAHEKDFSLDLLDRSVHDSVVVVENSELNDLAAQPFDVLGCVGFFDSEQDRQAVLNGAGDLAVNGHGSIGNTLNDSAHSLKG